MTILTSPSRFCYCTLDEVLEGHRHHCPEHRSCADCEADEDLSWLDDLVDGNE